MVSNINQLLVQAQTAYNASDWSSLIQYLQQLILGSDSQHPEVVKNRQYLLTLAISMLEMGDFQQRWEITKVLTHLGNIAIPPLIDILEDEDAEEELRWYAARTLGEFQHPEAIAPLVELLKTDEDEELKAIAATALGKMGTVAITSLTELLADEDTRLLAVRSLSCIPQTETITPLLSVVQDSQATIRTAAIEALSSFHDERIPPILLNALDDIAAIVRRAAVLGLGFRPDLREALDFVARLQPKLYDFNLDVCCAAAISLSRMGGNDAEKHLFNLLISPQTPTKLQLETIRALSWVGTPSSLEYLQTAFDQITSERLWQEIVTVLGRVQKPQTTQAVEILLQLLQSQHPATEIANVKSAIALSLGQLGEIQAIEPLISLLADSNVSVRLHAIAALKNLDGEVAHQKLQQLANNAALTPHLQQGIAIALAEW
ncbi:HEAT repeat domain-containing protein [Nostoc sp. UCD121]|uniref:HEAT repeat domain-containing protein n=1 Tax=unclassified Nostoc TaxID=2593658 RepID=UPI00162723E7|nr:MULTISPECIES: HEAT repeat domain-containing protein [unclassified Nostoc]MBC1218750.1 HEAT repeat domain-containing protein [Nostoc sp. UCD120]MBC1279289.1 HEAT repeat domain-containing protein [Nostoc sp. UCD121]MBC1295751.1 HEAT repeat domain-containing protein [Nostoc sp. UCD122]